MKTLKIDNENDLAKTNKRSFLMRRQTMLDDTEFNKDVSIFFNSILNSGKIFFLKFFIF